MSDLSTEEFRALRAAIAARGQLRATLTLAGLVGWAGLLIGVLIALPYPIASLIPLLVLVSTFEVIRPLHVGAERIGRYLQVFYEEAAACDAVTPAWERTAMALGATVPGAAGHPLFLPLFALATLLNLLAVLLPDPLPAEWIPLALPHAAFLVWLVLADRAMRTQRTRELARYRDTKNTKARPS
jgi:hypothetical protein